MSKMEMRTKILSGVRLLTKGRRSDEHKELFTSVRYVSRWLKTLPPDAEGDYAGIPYGYVPGILKLVVTHVSISGSFLLRL